MKRHGWKTYVAAGVIAVTAVLKYLEVIDAETEKTIVRVAEALLAVGIGHKLVKLTEKP